MLVATLVMLPVVCVMLWLGHLDYRDNILGLYLEV